MDWRDILLDGMLVLTIAVVVVGGVAVTYFLIWHVVKFICEEKNKSEGGDS